MKLYENRVVDRIVAILACFERGESELKLMELCEKTGLHKSTLYRLLEVLRAHRLVWLDETSGSYHLGLRLFELGSIAMGGLDLDRLAQPVLQELAEQTGETAHLAILEGSDILAIAKVESRSSLQIRSATGYRAPAYSTAVGKVLLAGLSGQELEAYFAKTPLVAFTRATVTSAARLRAELKTIAEQGYALDHEEREQGMRCVAAPVRDHTSQVVAGIGVLAPSIRLTSNKRTAKVTRMTLAAAATLSSRLGSQRAPGAKDGNGVTLLRSSEMRRSRSN
jgi:DNA-binding IclR family transcriptional regulator